MTKGVPLLTPERVAELDALGFDWSPSVTKGKARGPWIREQFVPALRAYVAEHGNAWVPDDYVTPDGYHLGKRIGFIRSERHGAGLPPGVREELDALGFWQPKPDRCPKGHEYTPENTLTDPSSGARRCRACRRPPPPPRPCRECGWDFTPEAGSSGRPAYCPECSKIPKLQRTGRRRGGYGNAVLTAEGVLDCRRRYAAGESFAALAREFGASESTISLAVRGETWATLPGAVRPAAATGSGARPQQPQAD